MKSLYTLILALLISLSAFAEKLEEIVIFEDTLGVTEEKSTSNLEVITSEKIKNLSPSSTPDLLKKISGVSVKSYDAKHVFVDMGGYGAEKGGLNTVILLNGRRINNPDMSGVDWSFIPVDSIERVEVYRGGNSVLFGDRATGGAINIVTKKPVKSGVSVKTEGGSYSSYQANVAGQYASDSIALLLAADTYKTDGYRDNSELKTKTVSGDFTYYHDRFELNANMMYTDSEYGLPGSLTKALIEEHGRDHSKSPRDGGDDYEYLYGAGGKVFLPLGEFNLKTGFRKRKRDYSLYSSFGEYKSDDKLKSASVNPYYILNVKNKNYSNRLIVGIDRIKYDVNVKTSSAFSTSSFELDRTMTGYYISDRAKMNGLIVEGGYRTQKMKDEYKTEKREKEETENAYNILAGYETDSFGIAYIRFDRSFRFPTTDELREYYGGLNSSLDTQTSKTYEAGYKYSRDTYYASVSAFTQKTDNEIFTNPTFTPYSNENLDTKRRGADFKAGYDNKILIAEASYSYVDAEVDEGSNNGKEVPLSSKNRVKATLGYKTPVGAGVYYFVSYYSSSYAGNDFTNDQDKLGAYTVSDFKVDYEKGGFGVYFKVNNMFNEKYYDYAFRTSSAESYYPAAERNFAAGITFRY